MTPAQWYARQRAKGAFAAGERRRAAGDIESAIDAFDEAARLDRKYGRLALDAAATVLMESGRKAEAAAKLRNLVELDKTDARSWRRLARVLVETGERNAAVKAWRRVLEADILDPEANRALVALLPENSVESLEPLFALAEGAPTDPKPWRRLARALEHNGRAEAAVEAWRRLLGGDPGDMQAHERLSSLLDALGRKSDALVHLRALAEAEPGKAKPWKRLARRLEELDQGAEAFNVWRRVLEIDPGDQQAHGGSIELLLAQGLKARAVPHMRAVAEAGGEERGAWRRLARTLMEITRRDEAIEAWRKLLSIDRADVEAHRAMAELFEDEPAKAVPHLRALAEATPKKVEVWKRLGEVLVGQGDAAGAIEAYRRALKLDGEDIEIHVALAELFKGKKADSLPHLLVLAEAGPDRAEARRRLADILHRTGDKEGALQSWERALELEPDDPGAHEGLAELLFDLGRASDAAVHLRWLVERLPEEDRLWRRLGRCLGQAGDAEGEIKVWRRVLAIRDDDLQAHERLAQLLTDVDRAEEAIPHYAAIVRLSPENPKTWRRYARALRNAGRAQGEFAPWREALAAAGQGELESLVGKAEEAGRRAQELKQELAAAGAEIKREKASAVHALSKFEREERAHRAAEALLKDEMAERRRLTLELQESSQRRRQAEAEEASGLLTARLLGLVEPTGAEERSSGLAVDAAGAYAVAALAAAADQGAVLAAGPGAGFGPELETTPPRELAVRLRRKSAKVVVLADPDPVVQAEARAELAGKRGIEVLELSDLLIRSAAGTPELKARIEPVAEDVWPNRPVMVVAADQRLRTAAVEAIGQATDLAFAPLFPAALASTVRARELDLDDWLAAAWSAHGRPRVFGFQFDAEALELFAHEVRSGRAQIMAKVFRRATALQLAWSDKAVCAANDYLQRAGDLAAGFDAGDAQMEVKTYKRLVHRDVRIENALGQLGKFRPAMAKLYRELFDKQALGRFCRDAGLALKVSGFAEVDEAALDYRPNAALEKMGDLIRDAVQSLTAAREPEAPPAGLIEFGLGRSLEALGRHAEALAAYQDALGKAPTYFPARAAAARYLELSGQAGDAERLLRQGLGNGTPAPDVQEGLLGFYQRNGSPLGVAATSRLMLKRGQSRPAIAAPALVELGRYRDAEPLLRSLGARLAGQDTFLADLLDIPGLAGELPELRAAADADADDGAVQLRLAEALRRLGRLPEALDAYRRALAQPGVLEVEYGVEDRHRPRFLMVGPPRTGTTLLRRLFDLHPQIAAPSGELFFFSNRSGQRAGSNRQRAPLRWYLEAFKAAAEAKPEARLFGEKTPHYFSMPDEQMAFASLLMPDVKIIATLRDPVVRAWSEIKVQRRTTEAEIVAALSKEARPGWFDEIIDAGRYVAHLKRWLNHVSPDRILLIDADALETNVVEEAQRLFRFLGVRELSQRQVTALQRGWDNRTESFAASPAIAELLRRSYADEPWRARDVRQALGLGEGTAKAPAPARPSRRRAAATAK